MKLTLITGPMHSSKSTELLARLRRARIAGLDTKLFKPEIDNRYSDTDVVTHDGIAQSALVVPKLYGNYLGDKPYPHLIGIDEAQFFTAADLLDYVDYLDCCGIRETVVAGLNLDFLAHPFPSVAQLMPFADEILVCKAICTQKFEDRICGEWASLTQRIVNGIPVTKADSTTIVGGAESYAPRCNDCFVRG